MSSEVPILQADHVSKVFATGQDTASRFARWLGASAKQRVVRAVSDVSVQLMKGRVLGLVGESGCGKSTLGRLLSGVLDPSSGAIRYRGRESASMDPAERRDAALKVQMIFQNPFASLNPRRRVRDIIGEAAVVHGLIARRDLVPAVAAVMQRVGLDPSLHDRFPHQLSGGQRQRVGIARALAVKPDVLVCDEAVAALDVSIQAQILNLFLDLRDELGLTYIFISHDLGVVHHLSDDVVIMYLGRIVERGPTEDLFCTPNHPYTQALLAEVSRTADRRRQYTVIKGEIASPSAPPSGCHFHPRCSHAMPICRDEYPALKLIAADRLSACHLNDRP